MRAKRPAPTQSDRLMRAYPELTSGRFAVIADFENPIHMELVQFIGTSPGAGCDLRAKGGRPDTGSGCLRLDAASADDAIIINNQQAENWYLQHDWRPYDLLLMSIETPQAGLSAEVMIAAGAEDDAMAVRSSRPLRRGWNVLRLDLAEVAAHLPLDEVREIRLAVGGANEPVTLHVDDLILAGNRKDLFGDSRDRSGRLYVQRAGRRWHVGAGGRFEVTFANGQIVGWHNLAADPYRLRNLVQGTTLGPSPVVVDPIGLDDGDFAGFGSAVVPRLQIMEMNEVRVVVASEWRYVDEPRGPLDERPYQRWVYTIYATGQLYASVECTASTGSWSPGPLGLAVTVASPDEDDIETHTAPGPTAEDGPVYATARNRSADSFLLYVPGGEQPPSRMIEEVNELQRRISFVAPGKEGETAVEEWSGHLLLVSANEIADDEAFARAQVYQRPPPLRLELGSPAILPGGEVNSDGFDAGSGCYVIDPDRGRVRFVIDAQTRPCFSPAFRIMNSADQEAQVYINHLVFDNVARDADGNLVFQVPRILRKRTMVEVLFRRLHRSGGA